MQARTKMQVHKRVKVAKALLKLRSPEAVTSRPRVNSRNWARKAMFNSRELSSTWTDPNQLLTKRFVSARLAKSSTVRHSGSPLLQTATSVPPWWTTWDLRVFATVDSLNLSSLLLHQLLSKKKATSRKAKLRKLVAKQEQPRKVSSAPSSDRRPHWFRM